MKSFEQKLLDMAVKIPNILLPYNSVDYKKFSVVACDQYSATPDYWETVSDIISQSPSALNMILPEAYLSNSNEETTKKINLTMETYLEDNTLVDIGKGMIFVQRQTSTGIRNGLILSLDLEQYDFSPNSKSLIRATENTVIDRLPSRIKVRENAPIEIPHTMVLIDDETNMVLGSIEKCIPQLKKLYDFELMQSGGHIAGFFVNSDEMLSTLADNLANLLENSDGMLFAMGDGNHSFAAAKSIWDSIKPTLTPKQQESHPARFSLIELVNLYDDAVGIEPIHRLLFNVDPIKVQQELNFNAESPCSLQILQPLLDDWLAKNPQVELEYIHGEQECRTLGNQSDRLAIIFPAFDKKSLFQTVKEDGVFARKSFSIGHANEKRYYLECNKIK